MQTFKIEKENTTNSESFSRELSSVDSSQEISLKCSGAKVSFRQIVWIVSLNIRRILLKFSPPVQRVSELFKLKYFYPSKTIVQKWAKAQCLCSLLKKNIIIKCVNFIRGFWPSNPPQKKLWSKNNNTRGYLNLEFLVKILLWLLAALYWNCVGEIVLENMDYRWILLTGWCESFALKLLQSSVWEGMG